MAMTFYGSIHFLQKSNPYLKSMLSMSAYIADKFHNWCSHFLVDSDNLFIKKKVVFKDPAVIMQMAIEPLVVFHDTLE